MRKAFDANVSRTKPRLRLGALVSTGVLDEPTQEPAAEPGQEALAMVEHATAQANVRDDPAPALAATTVQDKIAAHFPSPTFPQAPAAAEPEPPVAVTAAATPQPAVEAALAPVRAPAVAPAVAPSLQDSKERREKLKERLKAATAKVEPSQPTPQSPAEARTSALSLIAQLRVQLEDAQSLNLALGKDLEQTRSELARAAEEARARTGEATRMAEEVAQRARLIEELGHEMASLECERDDALVQLRSARLQVDQQADAARELSSRLAAREAELAETLTEEERLASELESRNAELRASQQAVAVLTEERESLSKQVSELTRERADLLDSQRALDEIHRALAEARVRVGGSKSAV